MTTYVVLTATDTGAGKTWSGVALAIALAESGRKRVVAIKPVETGTSVEPDGGEDGVMLAQATRQDAPKHALYRFRAAVAASVAADREGGAVVWRVLVEEIRRLSAGADIALLEGAGGLMAPITWEKGPLDLAMELKAKAVVAAVDRLGTINHVLLTVDRLKFHGIDVLGVVLSEPERADESTGTNAASLQRMRPGLRMFSVPRLMSPNDGAEYVAELARLI